MFQDLISGPLNNKSPLLLTPQILFLYWLLLVIIIHYDFSRTKILIILFVVKHVGVRQQPKCVPWELSKVNSGSSRKKFLFATLNNLTVFYRTVTYILMSGNLYLTRVNSKLNLCVAVWWMRRNRNIIMA